ncbi:MAG: Gfo/Idh/MocA family oxidoreductase [Candidatus Omnitrophica bacterium]|nr:Gfo/Idh/MocA family oxidoreductase [Candidatus Omnitrophota bacterium]
MIKIGVIGGGKFGTNHLITLSQLERQGRVKLAALADLSPSILETQTKKFNIKGYQDHREMLRQEELDAVTIATPDFAHRQVALDSIRSGKNVLIEKPLDITVEGCQEIIKAAEENKVFLEVDFHKRYDPYHQETERLVREGALGEIQYGYVHMEDKIVVPRDWFPGWAPRSSPAWFLGVHFYDLIRWILKKEPKTVFATGIKRVLAGLGVDTYDSIQAKVGFEGGTSITFDTSWILPDGFEAVVNQGFRLVGDKGVAEVDSQDRGMRTCLNQTGMQTHNLGFLQEKRDKWGNATFVGYGIESIADFVDNLEFINKGGDAKNLSGTVTALGADGLAATRMAAAVHESLESGKIINI